MHCRQEKLSYATADVSALGSRWGQKPRCRFVVSQIAEERHYAHEEKVGRVWERSVKDKMSLDEVRR